MKKNLLIFLIISSLNLSAQTAPSIQWQKSLGGTGVDFGNSIQRTSDGGYIIGGSSISNDVDVSGNHSKSFDIWIAKTNSNGDIQWQKSFGGSQSDNAYSEIQQTVDGGYIVAGTSDSNDGDVTGNHYGLLGNSIDYWVVKFDNFGNIQWQKSLGGSSDDYAYAIKQTTDGGYLVAGSTMSNDGDVSGNTSSTHPNAWIVKLDNSGNLQWEKSLGGSQWDEIRSFQQSTDGGYIFAGTSYSNDGDVGGHHGTTDTSDAWIVKLDTDGNLVWQKSLGGNNHDGLYSIQKTTDGGYITVGFSFSNDNDVSENRGAADYWIAKLDDNGNIQWQKSYGGSSGDFALSVQQTLNGGYIIAGESLSDDGDVSGHHGTTAYSDYWVVRINENGNLLWQKSLGGSSFDVAFSIQETLDNGFIMAGHSQSEDGDITGYINFPDYWIVKLSPENLATDEKNLSKINVYPNPVRETLYFSEEVSNIKITDISGRMVKYISTVEKSVNILNLAKGVYIISGTTKSGETVSKKIVKE